VPNALGGLADAAVFEAGVVALTPDAAGTTLLERTGLEDYWRKSGIQPDFRKG